MEAAKRAITDYALKKLTEVEKLANNHYIQKLKAQFELGAIHEMKGDYKKALEWTMRSLDVRKNSFGAESVKVANAEYQMARIMNQIDPGTPRKIVSKIKADALQYVLHAN